MSPPIASIVFAAFIWWLFWLDREKKSGTSGALWISVIWIGLASSRSASQWIYLSAPVDAADLVLEGSPIDRVVYSVLLLAGLIVLVSRSRKLKRLLQENISVLVFLVYCLISLLWSDFPDVAFKRWWKAVGDLIMVLIIWTEANPVTAVRTLFQRLTYILMPLSVLLIKYYPEYGRTYGRWLGEVHYTGVTTNKNSLGAICLLFGLGTLWHLLALFRERNEGGRRRKLIANAIALSIAIWLLSMADSMTSWSCFAIGTLIIVAANLRSISRRRWVLHFAITVMLLICLSVLFLGASPGTLDAMGKNPTLTSRTEMWPLLLSLCKSPLVGTGFGSFWLGPRLEEIWSVWEWKPNEAHNGYLEIYLNLGWIGLMLLGVVLVAGYRSAFVAYRRHRHLGTLLIAYFVVGIAYNFTEASFFQMLAPVWEILLLAMLGHAALAGSETQCGQKAEEGAPEPSYMETTRSVEAII